MDADRKREDQIQAAILLTGPELRRKILPISRTYLSRLTNHKKESERIPSVRIGRRPLYPLNEVMWYIEKHRFVPKAYRGKK